MLIPRSHFASVVRRLTALCLVLAAYQAAGDEVPLSDINYRLGEGFQIPGTGINFGGYATGTYDVPQDAPSRLALDNLSLFVWWEGDGRWKFFSELELENALYTRPSHRRDMRENDGYLSLERLYVDYALTDATNVRAGKFLTPIGHWNLIHATPLVWTTSRPLVTTLVFPTNMTGIMVTQTLPTVGNGIEYSVYGSSGNDLHTNPAQDPFSNVFGAHVNFSLQAGGQLGFSYADFEQARTRPERKQLLGVDFEWSRNRYEVSAEAAYRSSDIGGSRDERGAFVQAVAPLAEKLYAVGRYETFRTATEQTSTQLLVAGLHYRITPALVLKAEWVASKNNRVGAPDGFMSSVAVLF
jgi:hypothetical protein